MISKDKMSVTVGVAFVWFTTQFGGGFASGNQLRQYFVQFGVWAFACCVVLSGVYVGDACCLVDLFVVCEACFAVVVGIVCEVSAVNQSKRVSF